MEYMTTKEAAAKWGISNIRITILANEGRIPGAQRLGRRWLIPAIANKPPELKPSKSATHRKPKQEDTFSFPLYHFRPDWSMTKEKQLTQQQHTLLLAEAAVLECRFAEAYELLQPLLEAPEDKITEIGCLFNAGLCCAALNKPDNFSGIFLRLQMLLTEDFPHRDDLRITIDILKTYIESIESTAKDASGNTDIHYQCLPLMCIKFGYEHLSKEATKPGQAETALLELSLGLLNNTSAVIAVELLHLHLLGIYYLRHDLATAEKHAKAAVKIAFENKLYFPLITYYRYLTLLLSPIIAQYPKDFQKHCHELVSQYEKNITAFISAIAESSVVPKLTVEDFTYICAVMTEESNTSMANRLGVHPQTIEGRYLRLCKKFGVKSKKALRDSLLRYM